MHVVRHHYGSVELESFAIVIQTVLENCVAGFGRERLSTDFAERYEDSLAGFLIMRQHAAVFVHSIEWDA